MWDTIEHGVLSAEQGGSICDHQQLDTRIRAANVSQDRVGSVTRRIQSSVKNSKVIEWAGCYSLAAIHSPQFARAEIEGTA
jgi:hypothetical protein